MTEGPTNGKAFWSNLLDSLERYLDGMVDSTVFQKTTDFPDELAHGFHVVLDDEVWVTVRRDQVKSTYP